MNAKFFSVSHPFNLILNCTLNECNLYRLKRMKISPESYDFKS